MQYMARVGHDCSKQPLFSRLDHLCKRGASSERYLPLCSLPTRRSSLSLSRMVMKPQEAGEVYRREASVVAEPPLGAAARGAHWCIDNMRRTCIAEALLERITFRWAPTKKLVPTSTPSTSLTPPIRHLQGWRGQ